MKLVTGIGGIFFKARDPEKLREWYRAHLGIESDGDNGAASFHWREVEAPNQEGMTVWSAFPDTTKYFEPSAAPFMINYRVANLDWLLQQLRDEGVEVDPRIEESTTAGSRGSWIQRAIGSSCGNHLPLRSNSDLRASSHTERQAGLTNHYDT